MNNRSNHILNESLAREYQSGDSEALKELIRRFNPQLRSKIYYHTRNKESVQDISQDCWYTIITKLEEVKFQVGFEAWALNIARNKSIDWIRQQQRDRNRKQDSEQENSSSVKMEESNSRDSRINELRMSMNLLSDAQRIVLELFYVENLSIKEISNVLRISSGTVKSRLYTAREYLKKTIK
ncbi:MAG: sigma-70 family RNA polymerase sigma factor [Balneola sp.]